MTTKAFEKIMSEIFQQAKEAGNGNVIITLKNGETFNFNTGDNEEMATENGMTVGEVMTASRLSLEDFDERVTNQVKEEIARHQRNKDK